MILVTGGFGFIGSNLIRILNSRGITDIVVVDDLTNGAKMLNLNSCEFSNYYDVDEFFGRFDDWKSLKFIFHEGAISSTREMNGSLIMKRNYQFSEKLFGQAFINKIPFQYASSASVYGNVPPNVRIPEIAPTNPQTPYAFSKLLFDNKVKKIINSDYFPNMEFNVQGLRYFNVYGSNEDHKGDQASPITKFKIQAKETNQIQLFEGSENIFRDFVYVDDVVQAKLDLAFNRMNSGIFNIGTGNPISFKEVAMIVAKNQGANIVTVPFPNQYKNAYQYWTCADLTKLRNAGVSTSFRSVEEFFAQ
jgi:ADP-L-glycero-D-manno-heptose 6-epimerase